MSLYKDASLAMIPSAYKDGKLYSIRPTDGSGDFTFSRGSNLAATRVDVNGLIEKGRENLLYPSNLSSGFSETKSSTALNASDPYGGTEAIQFITNTDASTSHYLLKSVSISAASQVMTISVTAKPNGYNFLRLEQGNNSRGATFELTGEGTIVSDDIAASIEGIGNGWYRCSATFLSISTSIAYVVSYMPTSSLIYTGDGVSGGFLYGAQVEQGLVATDYIETGTSAAQSGILEDMPRLDYSGGASCPSLLLEPSRTNLLPQSEYYLSGGWVINSGTLTTNYAVSPEGLQNASKINFTSGGEIVRTTSFTAGQAYTLSFYAKVESGTFDFTYGNIDYTLTSGTATTEWQRFEITQTAPVASRYPKIDATNTGDLLIWGFQIEQGSYPTSYIPTYGSSVTRSFDNTSTLDLTDAGVDGEDVTYFFEFKNNQDIVRDSADIVIRVSADTGNLGSFRIYRSSSSFRQLTIVLQNNNGDFIPNGYEMTSDNPKIAIKRIWSTGQIQVFVDGTEVIDAVSNLFNRWYKMELKGAGDVVEIKQVVTFPTALTDSECIALTTL